LGSQAGGQPKIWGTMAHPGPPLESPLTRGTRKCYESSRGTSAQKG